MTQDQYFGLMVAIWIAHFSPKWLCGVIALCWLALSIWSKVTA